jgi:hypothetical protein
MDGIGSVGSTDAMLASAAETDTDKSVKLLKKSMQAEEDMVSTLLPPPGSPGGRLDIKA